MIRRLFFSLLIAPIAFGATSLDVVVPNQTTTSIPFNFTVTAKNGSTVDTGYTGTIHFTSNEATATLPADYMFVPADNGTHTFSATFNRSDDVNAHKLFTISARDTVNTSIAGTDVSDVYWSPDVARHLKFAGPGTPTRTVPFDITVSVVNAYDNVVSAYTGTVHFKGTQGVVLPPDYTYTPADGGVHTFSVTNNDGGYNIITGEDVADPTINGGLGFTVQCPELVLNAGNTGPVCPSGGSTVLYVSSNQTSMNYSWAGPPRGTYYGSGDTVTVSRPGTYTVLGTQTSNNCSTTAQTVVQEKSMTSPSFSQSANSVCAGGHVTVSLTNPSSFSGYQWGVTNGTVVSGQGTPSVEVQALDPNYSLLVYLSTTDNASGCSATHNAAMLGVGNAVYSDITTPAAACPNTTQSASVADSGAGATYNWTITNGTITGGQGTRIIAWKPDGNGDVNLGVVVTTSGCSASDTAVVTINGPTAQVSGDFGLCAGEQATIPVTLAGAPPFTLLWNDGVTQQNINTTSTTRTITATESATYSIALVTDANCNGIATGEASVVVQDAPAIETQPHSTSIQKGQTATLTVEALGENLTYDWYQGTTGDRSHLVAFGSSPSYTTPPLTQTTRYWVEVHSSCGATQSRTAVVSISGRRRTSRH